MSSTANKGIKTAALKKNLAKIQRNEFKWLYLVIDFL